MEKNTKLIFWVLGILLALAYLKDSKTTIESFSMFGNSAINTTLIGIPIILLLLIPIYGIYVSVKKGYNPFKMWGSWVGAIWGLLSNFTFGGEIENIVRAGSWRWVPYFPTMILHKLLNIGGISLLISSIILGFLLGWGVHSLIRRFR